MTFSDHGIVNGHDGNDQLYVFTSQGGLVQSGAGADHIETRDNTASGGLIEPDPR